MRTFTRETLAQYNGQNGAPSYVAYAGGVYDVSDSFLWQKGKHPVLHTAGKDWSGGIQDAPHGPELLLRYPIVGRLEG